jgi:hypothetical protein
MTSSDGTSSNVVTVIARRPLCDTATTAVAVERPSATTSISISTGGPTTTARANTACTERTDFCGNRLATATITCASTCVPSTT